MCLSVRAVGWSPQEETRWCLRGAPAAPGTARRVSWALGKVHQARQQRLARAARIQARARRRLIGWPMAVFVFFAAATVTRIIPPNLWHLTLLQHPNIVMKLNGRCNSSREEVLKQHN